MAGTGNGTCDVGGILVTRFAGEEFEARDILGVYPIALLTAI